MGLPALLPELSAKQGLVVMTNSLAIANTLRELENEPTLLMTGEEDRRTPISESEQFYQALQLRGVETAMVRIPGASHGIHIRPSNMMAKPAYITYWFNKYKK